MRDYRFVQATRVRTIDEMRATLGLEPTDPLPFGRVFAGYAFMADWTEQQGWHDPRLVPFEPRMVSPHQLDEDDEQLLVLIRQLQGMGYFNHLDPRSHLTDANRSLLRLVQHLMERCGNLAEVYKHYALSLFEGEKVRVGCHGDSLLLSCDSWNHERMVQGSAFIGGPAIPWQLWDQSHTVLLGRMVQDEQVPMGQGDSIYLRRQLLATEPTLGVKRGRSFRFVVMASPSGPYYRHGIQPIRLYVETSRARVAGERGRHKLAGNYADVKLQGWAVKLGLDQRLWLAAADLDRPVMDRRIEELGTANFGWLVRSGASGVAFCTPSERRGTILPSTKKRKAKLVMRREFQIDTVEMDFTVQELVDLHAAGRVLAMVNTGTAAGFGAVGELWLDGERVLEAKSDEGLDLVRRIDDRLTAIERGDHDRYGFTSRVCGMSDIGT